MKTPTPAQEIEPALVPKTLEYCSGVPFIPSFVFVERTDGITFIGTEFSRPLLHRFFEEQELVGSSHYTLNQDDDDVTYVLKRKNGTEGRMELKEKKRTKVVV